MHAIEVLESLRARDVTIEILADGRLGIEGDDLTEADADLVRQHKAVLQALVSVPAEVIVEMAEERAAIMEFDGGLDRERAERAARQDVEQAIAAWRRPEI